ncbi:hypothetical protein WL505_07995, partial [Staphylococcus warneri]
ESRHDDRNVEGRDARNGFDVDRREDNRHREDHHDVDRHDTEHSQSQFENETHNKDNFVDKVTRRFKNDDKK